MSSPLTPRRRQAIIGILLTLSAAGLVWAQPGLAQTATLTPTATATRTVIPTRTPTPTETRTPQPPVTEGPTRTPTLVPGPNTYTVQYGDTLLTIARRFGLTIPALRAANNLNSDTIYAGQVLFIPTPVPTTTKTAIPAGYTTYVVQPNDQLRALARRFGVTLTSLRTANNLSSYVLRVGQVLVIPPPAPTSTPRPPAATYVVQPGNQLLRLARLFGVTVTALRTANGLTSDVIRPGQVLVIPTVAPTRTVAPPSATPTGSYAVYVVKAGDRLQRIAIWYGVTMTAIRTANHLDGDTIRVGQTLTIPFPTRRPLAYLIRPGDTLIGLATRYATTVEAIKLANGMGEANTIFRGLTLIIPAPP